MTEETYRESLYRTYISGHTVQTHYATHDSVALRGPYTRRMIAIHFPPDRDAKIVDLGCGHGAILYHAAQAGYRNLEGIDRSPEQVAMARRLGIGSVHQADLTAAINDLASDSVDVLITFDVIEHLKRDELIRFATGAGRVVKPGGRWIVHVPNAEGLFGSRSRYGDLTHELAFTRSSINQLMTATGWTHVQCFEDAPVVHGFISFIRAILWRTLRALLISVLAVEQGHPDWQAILSQNLLAIVWK